MWLYFNPEKFSIQSNIIYLTESKKKRKKNAYFAYIKKL